MTPGWDSSSRQITSGTLLPVQASLRVVATSAPRTSKVDCDSHNEHAACRLRSWHRSAGRGRSELDASEPIWTLVYRPNAQDLVDILAHAAGSY